MSQVVVLRGATFLLIVAAFAAVVVGSRTFPSAEAGGSAPDFVIGVDTDGDGNDDCSTDGQNVCEVPGPTFTLRAYLASLGAAPAYHRYLLVLEDRGVQPVAGTADASLWPECVNERYDDAMIGEFWLECTAFDPATSTYTGLIGQVDFACAADGEIVMKHGSLYTRLVDIYGHSYGGGGSETLSVRCLAPGSGGPTLTPPPRPTAPACAGLDCGAPEFAIGIDIDGDGNNDCGTDAPIAVGDGAPDALGSLLANTACALPAGSQFVVNAYLTSTGGLSYGAQASHVLYDGVTFLDSGYALWQGCVLKATAFVSGMQFANVGCVIGVPPAAPVSHTGLMTKFLFRCDGDGTVQLGHERGETLLSDAQLAEHRESGSDVLSIDCSATTTSTPAVTDTPSPGATATPTIEFDEDPPPLPPVETPTPGPRAIAGDANCSGRADSVDATVVLQHDARLAGVVVPCPEDADVRRDGSINALDAGLILQYTAGLVSGFR